MKNLIVRQYLDLMNNQREAFFSGLNDLPEDLLWKRPDLHEWSVGENIDHMRVIYQSTLPLLIAAWYLLSPIACLFRARPYVTEIDNVYRRPGFPQNVGWIWPPQVTPARPVPLGVLYQNAVRVHRNIEKFFLPKDQDVLGHVTLWDPVIGKLNLIQTLRVGIYHDELHVEQIQKKLEWIRSTPNL